MLGQGPSQKHISLHQTIKMAIMANLGKCKICKKRIVAHEKFIKCSLCQWFNHNRCLPLYSQEDITYADNEVNNWSCPHCLHIFFPFGSIEDDSTFYDNINSIELRNIDRLNCSNMLYDPFEHNDDGGGGNT